VTVAWVGAGKLVTRAQAQRLPPLADLSATSPAIREAITAADATARARPGDAAAVGALGQAYHASGLAAQAMAVYEVADAVAGNDVKWAYLRALLLEERGDAAALGAALESITTRAPDLGLAWFRRGELAFKQRRLDDAKLAYEHARTAPPRPSTVPGAAARVSPPLGAYATFGLARIARERGAADEARQLLRTVAESAPGFGPPRVMLRALETASGASASPAFDAPYVPPADPWLDEVVAQSRHGDVLLKAAGQATRAGDKAWREYLVRRALEFNPSDLNVLMEMAAMLQATGRPEEALTYLRQHETLAPGDHHGLVEQGRCLTDLGRLDQAEAVLRRAVRVRDAAAEFNLGAVLDQKGQWENARERYLRALDIDPFHVRALNNLGVGLDRRGQSTAAVPYFERAIRIAPADAEFHANFGAALTQLRRLDDAVAELTKAVGLDPSSTTAHNNLGIARARMGDLAGARAEFIRVLQLDGNHAQARQNLIQVTAALGDGVVR
jgi:Flp pilus assembly protein TadD